MSAASFEDRLSDVREFYRILQQLEHLQEERLDAFFFAQLGETFGLEASCDDDPLETARRFTAQLVLVRAFNDAGQPDGFPYEARLPPPVTFERCEVFLDRWQRDRRYKTAYVRLCEQLERQYDLAGWATEMPLADGRAQGETVRQVESALWEKARTVMGGLASERDWHGWLSEHRPRFDLRANSFWAQEGDAPGWELLARSADLLTAIRGTCRDLDQQATPEAMLCRYAEDWWRVDYGFRRLREMLVAQPVSVDRLRKRCALSYREALRQMNDRFALLLETEGSWPPKGDPLAPQDDVWADIVQERGADQRVAVMFVDALRYELAGELRSALDSEAAGDRRALSARLAAIPTVTPVGMAAMLPGGNERQVDHDGEWQIVIGDSDNLKQKCARKAWLERQLDEAGADVAFYNLDELLATPIDAIPEKAFTMVFDTTLDAVGETAEKVAWTAFSRILQSVKKGIHRLLELGIRQVHVVSDHGFLLLDEVSEHEKVSVRSAPALARKSRYVVGRRLGHTDQLSFQIPGSPASDPLEAWFPRGVGCFRTPGPYNYVHGGLSLQELVIPHLIVEQHVVGRPVAVEADFPAVIRNAQPDIHVRPVGAGLFDRPRQVTVTLEKDGEPVVPGFSKVVRPAEPAKISAFLSMGCGLQPGDKVRWVLRDAVTEEVLAEQDAVSQVDLW